MTGRNRAVLRALGVRVASLPRAVLPLSLSLQVAPWRPLPVTKKLPTPSVACVSGSVQHPLLAPLDLGVGSGCLAPHFLWLCSGGDWAELPCRPEGRGPQGYGLCHAAGRGTLPPVSLAPEDLASRGAGKAPCREVGPPGRTGCRVRSGHWSTCEAAPPTRVHSRRWHVLLLPLPLTCC